MADHTDYEALAKDIESLKEIVTALLASLENEGFTPREARVIVTGMFAQAANLGDTDD